MNPYSNQNFGSDNPGMAGQHQDVSAANRENEESIKFQDILALCLKNWLWIAISLVICVTLGVLYLMRTQPEYTRSASLLIKNDSRILCRIFYRCSCFIFYGNGASPG